MEEIRIRDIIFNFRYMYLENVRRTSKKLRKHVSIDSPLIHDITLYLKGDKIGVRYDFKKGSVGDLLYRLNSSFNTNSYLMDAPEIKLNEEGIYSIDPRYKLSLKNNKLSKEIECTRKEEFYQNIKGLFFSGNMSINFTEFDISFQMDGITVIYNAVGDVIYTYSRKEYNIESVLETPVDIDSFDDYHKGPLTTIKKYVESDQDKYIDTETGDFSISENDRGYTLKKMKKGKIARYI